MPGSAVRAGLLVLAALALGWGLFLARPVPSAIVGVIRPLPAVSPGDGGVMTLAVLGTSLTARADWPEALRDRIAACSGREVRLVRVAEPGAYSGWGMAQVPALIAAAPDLVLVEFTINDADLRDGIGRAQSRDNHAEIIGRIRAARPEAAIGLLVLNPPRGLRALTRPFLGRYREIYRDLAQEEGVGLLDLHETWRKALALQPDLLPDGLHPTPEAVASVAQARIDGFVLAAVDQTC